MKRRSESDTPNGTPIHFPREVWACIMAYNAYDRENQRLKYNLKQLNEFCDQVIENLDQSTRIQETLHWQLRRLQGKCTRLKRLNQVLTSSLRLQRGSEEQPIEFFTDSSSDESTIIDVTSDNDIDI